MQRTGSRSVSGFDESYDGMLSGPWMSSVVFRFREKTNMAIRCSEFQPLTSLIQGQLCDRAD